MLRGEIFFYEHMPEDIKHYFPNLVACFNNTPKRSPTATSPRSPRGSATAQPNATAAATTSTVPSGQPSTSPTPPAVATPPPPPHAAAASTPNGADPRGAMPTSVPKPPPISMPVTMTTSSLLAPAGGVDGLDDGGSAAAALSSAASDGISSLTLSRVKGVTFSHLITNRSLTPGRLILHLKALRQLHSSVGDAATLRPVEDVHVCANYLPKLRKRYQAHQALYSRLSSRADYMYKWLEEALGTYESDQRWHHAAVIHGDPVFSNVLLTDDGRIYLLDMRGELGSVLTLQGDLTYDLSKVYQSLLGYDYIILSQPLLERDAEILEELRHTFRTFVSEHYPSVVHDDIVKLTASHYFGIVPLHVNKDHQVAYLQTAEALISSLPPHSAA